MACPGFTRRRLKFWNSAPGRGLFAQDVLDWSEKKFPEFFRALHYSLAERSPALRGQLQQYAGRFLEEWKSVPLFPETAAREDQPER